MQFRDAKLPVDQDFVVNPPDLIQGRFEARGWCEH